MSIIIAFSGIDGSGKSTYIKYIKDSLEKKNISVKAYNPMKSGRYNRSLKEGSNCKSNDDLYSNFDKSLISITYALDLVEFMNSIKELKTDVVLIHRHSLCCNTCAELFFKPPKLFKQILGLLEEPNLSVHLDVDVEIALERIKSRGEKRSVKESKNNLNFCRERYKNSLEKKKGNYFFFNTNLDISYNKEKLILLESKIRDILKTNM